MADLKETFKHEASRHPEKHYPVKALEEHGFKRNHCQNCKRHFWSSIPTNHCGDAACSGGFRFINNPPTKKKLSYSDTWKTFAKIHTALGYTPIKRYPVVARWNPTTDFTIASIAAFQPYVVSGEIEPPANPLVIPQYCLRFPDIDNVGITGHFVGFVMMGEHAFVPPKDYNINKYFTDHYTWLTKGMGLPPEEFVIHEDAWEGGGNLGPCVEFFSRGLEVSNQVYMQYEATPAGIQELKIKVLDMGQGQERVPWLTNGNPTIYESVFPDVMKKLRAITKTTFNQDLWTQFAPHSKSLDINETSDPKKAWTLIAKKLDITQQQLEHDIYEPAHLYAIAEHTRALLIALADGALPSNVGGMYNLRIILRRALHFIAQHQWDLDLLDICSWHAKELKPQYPELLEALNHIKPILDSEKEKYEATQIKSRTLIEKYITKGNITKNELIELYDSHGIAPETLAAEAHHHNVTLTLPKDFYAEVAKRHEHKEQETATKRAEAIPFPPLPETKALYYEDYALKEFTGKILAITNNYVVLDKTAFYPTSGGQLADRGTMNGIPIVDVFKQGHLIIHHLEKTPFKIGETVQGIIDWERRKQLAQHHTATHIVNAAARTVLGPHINQASARKDLDHAYLDITHYQSLDDKQLKKIEDTANRIIQKKIATKLHFIPRTQAELTYGTAIYQGGAVPGKILRIVEIPSIDIEACGGTHLHNTSETELIKITKSVKVKDGIVRIYFTAGNAAKKLLEENTTRLNEIAQLLGKCTFEQIPGRAQELFEKWKKTKKLSHDHQSPKELLTLTSTQKSSGNILVETAETLRTQPEHIVKTIQRFLNEIKRAQ